MFWGWWSQPFVWKCAWFTDTWDRSYRIDVRHKLWSQIIQVHVMVPLLTFCVILDELVNFAESPFPHLYKGNRNNSYKWYTLLVLINIQFSFPSGYSVDWPFLSNPATGWGHVTQSGQWNIVELKSINFRMRAWKAHMKFPSLSSLTGATTEEDSC